MNECVSVCVCVCVTKGFSEYVRKLGWGVGEVLWGGTGNKVQYDFALFSSSLSVPPPTCVRSAYA